ncbi:alpha/beta fold hydrolase [Actinopolymorpha rutila]|uniref:Pimeloyl-ACP methyl ester carboxylesterase n=1 Tax=Actinopolymorpha rutila TaxID=446787 RepID=A0A852ZIT3_9ACTN|nr:alpha/beta hydrolase [Actinopolymorpha rutila]NYH91808.1 pimeloyl-ACP methyl ester carboxylesterase [Actinopolymorpha rutila]
MAGELNRVGRAVDRAGQVGRLGRATRVSRVAQVAKAARAARPGRADGADRMVELLGSRTGVLGAATGMLAAGAAAGIALERYVVGRRRTADLRDDGPLGTRRGAPTIVKTADGLELYAEVDEPNPRVPNPLTVVFCHGYALNLDCWHFQRAALAGEARMVFYDQRSHGRSGRSPSTLCNVDQLGKDLGEVLTALAPEGPVVLVGHSMGGMSVLALADQHPEIFAERVVGVALLASSAGGLDSVTLGVPGPVGRLVHRLTPAAVAAMSRAPGLIERGRKAGSDVAYFLTKHYSFGSKVSRARVEFVAEMLASTPIEVVADFYPGFAQHDKYHALEALHGVETLVMGGREDLITPVEHSREIAERHPAAEYIELSDSGHMFLIEHPDVVNAALADLLGRAAAAAGSMTQPPVDETG